MTIPRLWSIAAGISAVVALFPAPLVAQPTWTLSFSSARTGRFEVWTADIDISGTPVGAPTQRTSTGAGQESRGPDSSVLNRIAYQFGASGARSIHVVHGTGPVGNGDLRLTPPPSERRGCPGDARDPTWSPDGKFIAYSCLVGTTYDIWIHDTNGTPDSTSDDQGYALIERSITSELRPSWSPDGTQLALVTGTQIAVQTVTRDAGRVALVGGLKILTANPFINFDPSWSRDGKEIAYSTTRNGARDIYRMMAATGEDDPDNPSVRLTFGGGDNVNPAWSPDSKWIAFVSDREGNREIYIMSAKNGDRDAATFVRVTDNVAEDGDPAWDRTVHRFSQCADPWRETPYAFHDASETESTICKLGCAMVSLSMALRSQGVRTVPSCATLGGCALSRVNLDPGSINALMTRSAIVTDYTVGALDDPSDVDNNVDYAVTTKDVGALTGNPKYDFVGPPTSLESVAGVSVRSADAAHQFLNDALWAGTPVIVRVRRQISNGRVIWRHKVLVIAPRGDDDYWINDPADTPGGSGLPRNTLLSQYGAFDVAGFVKDPEGDRSSVHLAVGGNVDFVVMDSSGRRTGVDSGIDLREIPDSGYLLDSIHDEDVEERDFRPTHFVHFTKPEDSVYQLLLTGVEAGEYTLQVSTFAVDGTAQPAVKISGLVAPGGGVLLTLQVDTSPGGEPMIGEADVTPPVIDPAADIIAEATSAAGAIVAYTSPASHDDADGPGITTCMPVAGSVFAIKTTTVTCSARDSGGNESSVTFKVVVQDTTAPTITPPNDIIAEATGPSGAGVEYVLPMTNDIVDGQGTATCVPSSGSPFLLGVTRVICTARDAAGNSATASFNVRVLDTTAPTLTVSPSTSMLWPPTDKLVPVVISGLMADSASGIDLASARFRVIDEYGAIQPTGLIGVQPDGAYSFIAMLEASRRGQDQDGRRYEVLVEVADNASNRASGAAFVMVPHDQRR
jgi:hypothetical protein